MQQGFRELPFRWPAPPPGGGARKDAACAVPMVMLSNRSLAIVITSSWPQWFVAISPCPLDVEPYGPGDSEHAPGNACCIVCARTCECASLITRRSTEDLPRFFLHVLGKSTMAGGGPAQGQSSQIISSGGAALPLPAAGPWVSGRHESSRDLRTRTYSPSPRAPLAHRLAAELPGSNTGTALPPAVPASRFAFGAQRDQSAPPSRPRLISPCPHRFQLRSEGPHGYTP